jgi:hypothetical protein
MQARRLVIATVKRCTSRFAVGRLEAKQVSIFTVAGSLIV